MTLDDEIRALERRVAEGDASAVARLDERLLLAGVWTPRLVGARLWRFTCELGGDPRHGRWIEDAAREAWAVVREETHALRSESLDCARRNHDKCLHLGVTLVLEPDQVAVQVYDEREAQKMPSGFPRHGRWKSRHRDAILRWVDADLPQKIVVPRPVFAAFVEGG